MKLSIIIPVFNEERTIGKVLQQLNELNIVQTEVEILVVDDGSTDDTIEKINDQLLKTKKTTLLQHSINKGKGVAVRTGIKKAKGEYILIQDADLEYDPSDIEKLVVPVLKNQATVVYGTRLKRLPNFSADERTPQFFLHYVGNKLLSLLTSILYGQWITDMETGYKLFPKNMVQKFNLKARSFDFEPEITAKILKTGVKILEIPIRTNPRGYAQGKKLNTVRDGAIALYTLIKYRLID